MKKYFEPDYARIPDEPQMTVEVKDEAAGLEAYVCIHSMGRFGASGGMRCAPNVTKKEVQLLAKAMTYKYSFWDIEQGGAKAGLVMPYDSTRERKGELQQRAAVHLEPLVKSFIWSPWTDMNFYGADLSAFYAGIGIDYKPSASGSSERTAISAFASLRACVEFLGVSPGEAKIAIEGFGNVAYYLARFIKDYGARIVAVSNHLGCIVNENGLDIDQLVQRRDMANPGWITAPGPWDMYPKERLFAVPCDVLVPGARVHTIDGPLAATFSAKALVPTANVPCTDDALATLDKRGVPFVPDFVVNGGGVCGHIWGHDRNGETVGAFVDGLRAMVLRMLRASETAGAPARMLAERIAHANYGAIARDAYRRESRLSRIMRELQKRHLLPGNAEAKTQELRTRRTLVMLDGAFR